MKKRILVLAPHTDDGELGCGGTIAKYCMMDCDVYYVAFSTCRRSLPAGWEPDTLEKEVKNATAVLGVPRQNLILFDYDVRTFKTERQNILEDILKLKKDLQPNMVFVPSPNDIHQDHQAISEEGVRAFKTSTILGYEMPWNNISFNTLAFQILDETHIIKKCDALYEYKSQLHRNYTNKEFIYSLARVRGAQIDVPFAEAFEVIRTIL